MITEEQVANHWDYMKAQLRKEWGELTDDDIEKSKGDMQMLVATIEQKSGEAKREIEDKLEELALESASFTARAGAAARDYADQASQALHDAFDGVSQSVQHRLEDAERLVRKHPKESAMVTFGTGLIAGVILGMVIRGR